MAKHFLSKITLQLFSIFKNAGSKMKSLTFKLSLGVLFCFVSIVTNAQNYQLSGKSAIGFNLGLYSGSKTTGTASINGLNTEVSSSGFYGSIFYSHWLKENVSLRLSAGLLTASANVSINTTNTAQASAVFPLLLGLDYYFLQPTNSDAIRPFVSASIGMFVGSEAKNTTISQQVHSENTIGGRIGLGSDFLVGDHFIIGANLGYNLMADFSNAVGGKKNFNGLDFALQLDYVF